MKRELIIASVLIIISTNLIAQDNISGQEDKMTGTGINKPAMENELMGMPENNLSMSETARETPSGPGKGIIVSSQARQLGSAKRHNMNKENAVMSHNEKRNRNRMQIHASPMRRNPDLIALNSARGVHRSSFHGRK